MLIRSMGACRHVMGLVCRVAKHVYGLWRRRAAAPPRGWRATARGPARSYVARASRSATHAGRFPRNTSSRTMTPCFFSQTSTALCRPCPCRSMLHVHSRSSRRLATPCPLSRPTPAHKHRITLTCEPLALHSQPAQCPRTRPTRMFLDVIVYNIF